MVSVKSHTLLSAGYSRTPLAKKLGIAAGSRVCALSPPLAYRERVTARPEGADRAARADVVHLCVCERAVVRGPTRP